MKIDLNKNTRCISMSPWRQCFMRRIFHERGLSMPPVTYPIIPEKPTRPREPKAYSSLALTFIRLILEAEKDGLPYLIIYEDDAYPVLTRKGSSTSCWLSTRSRKMVVCCVWVMPMV